MTLFTELPIRAYLQERLSANQFINPTPVQEAALPPALAGSDILATAQTGTGKTLAFLLPIMEHLLARKPEGIAALVLVPTRELAMQVVAQYDALRGRKLPAAAQIVGGLSEKAQIQSVRSGARLVVATPGRLEDLTGRRLLNLASVKVLVLDEADRMLDMGFIQAIRRIVALLPRQRQTMLFSATLDAAVAHLIHDYLKDPVRVAIGSVTRPVESVRLHAYEVANDQKLALLQRLLSDESGRTLVFARTKRGTERLAQKLVRDGFAAGMIHGNRSQSQRTAALTDFQRGRTRLLIATDVAARGIHVDDIAHVINYDLPEAAEDFVHRVGRTGRAGAQGKASTFFAPQDRREVSKLERTLSIKMERMVVTDGLEREQRVAAVNTSDYVPRQVAPGSRMVSLPGEVLQRYA
ncbi:MAG TPA: DEAD/DEAH box helicase [Terriglobales bacterium]|nr:DEAD/DEAH box helicase [Terriglobales bacterium]